MPNNEKQWAVLCMWLDKNEALLGPLPKEHKFVSQLRDDVSWFVVYVDLGTRETIVDDPRLDPFPAGWHNSYYKAMQAYLLYVKEDNPIYAEREIHEQRTLLDLMLTSEVLAARNVDLIDFGPV